MERSHKDQMDNITEEVWDTEKDDYLEFCAENWLDPDSKIAIRLWGERVDGFSN